MNAPDLVMQSYGRCCAQADFFDLFYKNFLSSSPEVRDKFVNTDMHSQKLLLRQGILNIVLHARGMPDTKLRALGCSHARDKLNIRPELYQLWLKALLVTLEEKDPEFTPEIRDSWKQVINRAIEIITASY